MRIILKPPTGALQPEQTHICHFTTTKNIFVKKLFT